jgi:hypothetical protein
MNEKDLVNINPNFIKEDKNMTAYNFDDRNIQWHKLGNFEHFVYAILDIEKQSKIVDVLFKFEPHKQIVLHRHRALNKSLVIQGEHHIYKANGKLEEVRVIGSYTSSPASNAPHRECGGDEGAIVYFSIRDSDGILYEVLDDEQNIIGTLSMQDFIDLYEANEKKPESEQH